MREFRCRSRADWHDLTDARKLWCILNEAGPEGAHSHDLRALGITGNPSQRLKDIASEGISVFKLREPRGKRPGIRAWLDGWQPEDAFPVLPNHASGADGGGEAENGTSAAPVSAAPYELIRDFDGTWREEPLAA
jgi:hypothetical protein